MSYIRTIGKHTLRLLDCFWRTTTSHFDQTWHPKESISKRTLCKQHEFVYLELRQHGSRFVHLYVHRSAIVPIIEAVQPNSPTHTPLLSRKINFMQSRHDSEETA